MRSIGSLIAFVTSATGAAITSASHAIAAAATGNPFSGYQLYANSYYASEISASALPSMTGTAKTAAASVAEVPSFYWL